MCEALAQQHGVFGEHQAHGRSALMVVPPPGGLVTVNRPPSAATRSARPVKPDPPRAGAPPIPSSRTSTTRRVPSLHAVTSAFEAPAWRAALASASLMTK